jgi:glycine cleavage system H protein
MSATFGNGGNNLGREEKIMLFSQNHMWIAVTENTARIGISDYAQSELGAITFLNLPDIGDELTIGERFGDIESLKTISDLISPVSGTVTAVNSDLVDAPEMINTEPYPSLWFIEAAVNDLADGLMNESAYAVYTRAL